MNSDDDETDAEENAEEFSESSSNSDIPSMSISIASNTPTINDSEVSGYDEKHKSETLHNLIDTSKKQITNLFDIPEPQSKSVNISSNESTIFRQPIPKPRTTINLFDDEPPELDTISIASKRKSPINLFLDDEDIEENVTKQIDIKQKLNQPSTSIGNAKYLPSQNSFDNSCNVVPKKTVNLFDDDIDTLIHNEHLSKSPISAVKEKKTTITNIFDDEPSEDLFDVLISKSKTVKPTISTTNRSLFDGNLFDDMEETTQKTVPTNRNTIDQEHLSKNESKIVNKSSVSKNIFDDDSDNSDKDFDKLFGSSVITSRSKKNPEYEAKKVSYEDPLFSTASTSSSAKVQPQNESKNKKSDDYMKSMAINLFDVDKDDSLFSDKTNALPAKSSHENQNIKKNISANRPNIFDSNDDTDLKPDYDKLFPKVNITQKQQQQQKKEIKPITNESKSKSNISNNKKSIFDDNDEWTDEHDELFGKSSKSDTTNTSSNLFNENTKNVEQSSSKFRSFLDSESSPPADNVFSTETFSSSHNLFDNLLLPSNNIPEANLKKSDDQHFPSNLLNNSPPPLDDIIASDEIDRSTEKRNEPSSNNNRFSLFLSQSNFAENTKSSSIETDTEKKQKPKKLNHGLNINVKALLPGAKLPSSKLTAIAKTSSSTSEIADKKTFVDESSATSKIEKLHDDDQTERLVGLTKSRPKLSGQRKASTRRGRQEQYRKSILVQDNEFVNNSETKEQKIIPLNKDIKKETKIEANVDKITKIDNNNDKEDNNDDDDWLKVATNKIATELFDGNNFHETPPPLDDWLDNKEKTIDNVSIKLPSTKSSSIFANVSHISLNNRDDDENLLFDIPPPLNNITDDDDEKQFDSPFDDNNSSFIEDDWQTFASTFPQKSSISETPALSSEIDQVDRIINHPTLIDNNAKLFDDDDYANDFKKPSITIPSFSTVESLINQTVSMDINAKLFEDDNDDYFKKSQQPAALSECSDTVIDSLIKKSTSVGQTSQLFDDDDNFNKSSISVLSRPSTTIDSIIKKVEPVGKIEKLFSDDDDNEDDLFGGKSSNIISAVKDYDHRKIIVNEQTETKSKNITSQQLTKKKSFSFLDSDTDDGDDLFGGNKNSIIKPISNRIKDKIKATGSSKSSGRLFDDDSDDDDDIDGDALFSSKRKYTVKFQIIFILFFYIFF